MNIIRKIALDNILQVLNCPCGSRIPRSGVAGERANCFVVYIENSGKPYLMVESSEGKELKCKEWDGNRFSIDKTINLDEVIDTDLYVIHYYGLNDIEYRGFNEFLKGRILKIVYAKILIN